MFGVGEGRGEGGEREGLAKAHRHSSVLGPVCVCVGVWVCLCVFVMGCFWCII